MAVVGLLVSRKFRARQKVCPDLMEGMARLGQKVVKVWSHDYREVFSDAVVFYGFDGSRDSLITKAFHDYQAAGKPAVYIDLGYFSQKWNGDRYGYHRFSVNSRHPTAYFNRVKHPPDRFRVHNREVAKRMKQGSNILLCGMSQKCSLFEGFAFEEWERDAITKIRAVTDRPIVYRPKPKRSREPQSPPIQGVGFSDPSKQKMSNALQDAWCVVSHHSNANIDALLAGVPSFTDEGPATVLSAPLDKIEQPLLPTHEERMQFASDVAYCQFNREEMRSGVAWRHLKDEGLVP
jgi:hypothetical protein